MFVRHYCSPPCAELSPSFWLSAAATKSPKSEALPALAIVTNSITEVVALSEPPAAIPRVALEVQQSGSTFKVHMDANSLGYNLSPDDEIVAWGKFNS